MIGIGADAPRFTLPAVEDGAFRDVDLAEYLGENIVVLAFYPADFNPCCDGETTDLDELDLFTLQKDVAVLGISGDSVYSHRAFAESYDLRVPLLADVDGSVAADYGVAVDDPTAGYGTRRAVVVIGPGSEVEYTWQTDDLTELPPVDAVREAVERVGGSDTAKARYRIGHAHYVEGRRAFTSAMGEFESREWVIAQGDYGRAREEFDEAAAQFNAAARFAASEETRMHFERAERKAGALSQAAEWLAQSASAYASGEGMEGDSLRKDAERPLETARDIDEPPPPDDFPPERATAESDSERVTPTDESGVDSSLDAELDAATDESETAETAESTAAEDEESTDEIDDEELAEIAAEVEAQTRQAQARRDAAEEEAEEADSEPESDEEDGSGELDEAADEDEGILEEGGSHGVPDSL